MTPKPATRPRGRPPSGQAKPPAQRMMAMRQRTITTVQDGETSLESLPVSGLLEALRLGYQAGRTWDVVDVCAELIARLSEAPGATVRLKCEFTAF
jgi:hypothetical protein